MPVALFYVLSIVFFLNNDVFAFSKPSVNTPQWGFYSHRTINRQAVFTLPPEMMVFFKKNIEYLTLHAVDPDMRRYASDFEAVRHYIDLDHYGKAPFPDLPRNWPDALLKYCNFYFVNAKNDTLPLLDGQVSFEKKEILLHPKLSNGPQMQVTLSEFRRFFSRTVLPQYYEEIWNLHLDSLKALLPGSELNAQQVFAVDGFSQHGILPYNLVRMLERLSDAFRQKDTRSILRHAADIGHYIGDAHVPLHTTKNYNGQLSNQLGIHAFWETRLPELFAASSYDFWVGKAEFIAKPNDFFWNIVLKSHSYVDSVLLIEKEISENIGPDERICNELRGDALVVTQCEEFAKIYHARMGGMVEERMRGAIQSLGSVWYTAWVMAGQPDLSALGEGSADEEQAELEKAFRAGKEKGRPHEGNNSEK